MLSRKFCYTCKKLHFYFVNRFLELDQISSRKKFFCANLLENCYVWALLPGHFLETEFSASVAKLLKQLNV